ncbi:MAG: ABC transporter permease [Bacteroidales bacterium]
MFKTYFISALRNIEKHKFYSLLNIFGFGLGIAVFIFIALYLWDQSKYDKWYTDHERIYRFEFGEWGITGPVYKRFAEQASADVKEVIRVNNNAFVRAPVKINEKVMRIEHLIAADPGFIDFFDIEFIHGSPEHALENNNSIILSENEALKLFGHIDVVGETLKVLDKFNMRVSGVIKNIEHFHIKIDAAISFQIFRDIYGDDYMESTGNWNHLTYIKTHPEANIKAVEQNIQNFITDYFQENHEMVFDKAVNLRPVKEVYYTNDIKYESSVLHGNKTLSTTFLIIALFILLIAIINFINLSTSQSAGRAKEVGIRKLLGSRRKHLVIQFLTESVIITTISVLFAFAMVEILMPWFNNIIQGELSLKHSRPIILVGLFLGGSILVGLISGLYPALYLTSFQPAPVLKGEITRGKGASNFRRILIVVQFAISMALIAGTMIVYKQLHFMQNQELPYQEENIVHFRENKKIREKYDDFRHQLLSYPQIEQVALSYAVPGEVRWQESLKLDGETRQFYYWPLTPEFFEILNIEPLSGRLPSREFPSDEAKNVVVNEKWAQYMGYTEPYDDLIGTEVQGFYIKSNIVGIIPDFHFNSLHQSIAPLMLVWDEGKTQTISIKIKEGEKYNMIPKISELWSTYYPEEPLPYKFLDESLSALYDKEKRMGLLFVSFSVFAVLIACLGLFGLASFTIEKRMREIAIRKVLGASVSNLVNLLLKDFTALVILAIFVAFPVSWYAMDKWINSFAYQSQQGFFPYLVAVTLTMLVTIATIGYHALLASRNDPSNALRKE